MVYKITKLGTDYKIGDMVPDEVGDVWEQMGYAVKHWVKITDDKPKVVETPKPVVKVEIPVPPPAPVKKPSRWGKK